MAAERLQKILARAGIASRRAAEGLIVAGRVRVNGRVVSELGARADARRDKVEVDGKRLVLDAPVYYLLHKPREVMTTLQDPEGRRTIRHFLQGIDARVVPVGRLDFHDSGALLLTNDGDLVQALTHPAKPITRTYAVKMRGDLDVKELDALRNGVVLDDGEKTRKAEVFVLNSEGKNTWASITTSEVRPQLIERMGEAIGRKVLRINRVVFAGLSVEGLKPGQWRPLEEKEVEKLKKAFVLPKGEVSAAAGPRRSRS
jgi:23S rRNA pseudouridine2605 synthase